MSNMKRAAFGCALFFCLTSCAVSSGVRESVYVDRVVDGDTVRLDNHDSIRLIGINAPELRHEQRAAEAFSRQAKDELARLVEDRRVLLTAGVERRDRYKRRLAYLFLPNGRDVQEDLLERGLAFAIAIPPNDKYAEKYLSIENEARKARRGLWAKQERLFKDPKSITSKDKGRFRLVKGKVARVIRARRHIYLKLGKSFTVKIPQKVWRANWRGNPGRLRGKKLEARGWVWKNRYGYVLSVNHPIMMRIDE